MHVNEASKASERTLAIAITEVRYAIHFAGRNEAYWRHLDTLLNMVNALAGSAAFGAVFAQNTAIGAIAGICVAISSCTSLVMKPIDKAVEFRDFRRRFAKLDAEAWEMTLSELDKVLKVLRQEGPMGFESLGAVAWNDAMLADGHVERASELTWFQRIMSLMA
jgi:hypothetical protein